MSPVSTPPPGRPVVSSEERSSFGGPLVERLFRPSQPAIDPQQFQGQSLLVVFNPRARDGAFAGEAESLKRNLEGMGFHVVFVRTVADPVERSALVREAAARLLADPQGGPIHVFPVGGDRTVNDTVREVVEQITGPLREVPPDSPMNELVRQRVGSVVVAQVGRAGDIARQLGAPPSFHRLRSFFRPRFLFEPLPYFSEVPPFIRRSQLMPLGIASVEAPGVTGETAFHSVGFGTSGDLFGRVEANRSAAPDNPLNQGLLGYFRVLPLSIREYGLLGVEVEIEHHGRVDRFRVGELLGSSNRVVALVGGVPGRWGEFKIIAVPNGPHGIFVMGESMFRGVATQLGINMVGAMHNRWITRAAFRLAQRTVGRFGVHFDFNLVGADSVLWSLSRERQITLRPGERAKVRFFDPSSGVPVEVPWQLNGDTIPKRTHEAEIYVPPITVPMRVRPGAVALRLYERDELRRGLSISDGTQPPLPIASEIEPPSLRPTLLGGTRAASAFYPASDLRALVTGLDLEPSRLPLLVARAHAVHSPSQLFRIQSGSFSMEHVERWVGSEEGQRQIAAERLLLGDTFRNRLETHGVGLGLGLITLYASNRLMDHWGIDPRRDPVLHFTGVTLSSHTMNLVGNGWAGVLINRARGIPYDWAMAETRGAHGLFASRMIYETNPTLLRALGSSTLRNLGLQGGARDFLLRYGPRQLIGGMGAGLACSRITETVLGRYTSLSDSTRSSISSAAFFTPSVYHLLAGNRGLGVLESTTVRRVNAAFALGFAADLGFMAGQWAYFDHFGRHGSGYERWVNHRASALREAEEDSGPFPLRGLAQLIAPELAAWWDTVDGWDLHRNRYYQRILEADRARLEAFAR